MFPLLGTFLDGQRDLGKGVITVGITLEHLKIGNVYAEAEGTKIK